MSTDTPQCPGTVTDIDDTEVMPICRNPRREGLKIVIELIDVPELLAANADRVGEKVALGVADLRLGLGVAATGRRAGRRGGEGADSSSVRSPPSHTPVHEAFGGLP